MKLLSLFSFMCLSLVLFSMAHRLVSCYCFVQPYTKMSSAMATMPGSPSYASSTLRWNSSWYDSKGKSLEPVSSKYGRSQHGWLVAKLYCPISRPGVQYSEELGTGRSWRDFIQSGEQIVGSLNGFIQCAGFRHTLSSPVFGFSGNSPMPLNTSANSSVMVVLVGIFSTCQANSWNSNPSEERGHLRVPSSVIRTLVYLTPCNIW